ncbi:sentrin-specific protease 1-like [Brachionus plicatilis]|uniref:Sentrin-specific protease 1-like n=1 Tax=Brachionus plicatilis TaxID=10195 RepID=A0A3M7S4W4_BRAPC|nr:sentrin-specific protease 1-like [Brachionus plicatilis]
MQNIQFLESIQGNPLIHLNQNIFIKWALRDNGNIYWKCSLHRKSDCKASVTTVGMSKEIYSSNLTHFGHNDVTDLDVRLLKCMNTVNKRARNEYGSLHSIYRDEINTILEENYDIDELAAKMPKFDNFYNNGPRTNNHVEGFHRKIDCDLITNYVKKLESEFVLVYKRRNCADDFNVKRRPEYIYRDNKIFNWKNNEKNQEQDPEIAKKIEEYKQLVENAFKNFTEINGFGIKLLKSDISRLKPKCWLNDNIVNYFLHLLTLHTTRKSFNCQTYLYSFIIEKGYASVINWWKNCNLFEYDLIYAPVNVDNKHWILVSIESFKCLVTVYDSLMDDQSNVLSIIREFLDQKYIQKYGVHLTSQKTWDFIAIIRVDFPPDPVSSIKVLKQKITQVEQETPQETEAEKVVQASTNSDIIKLVAVLFNLGDRLINTIFNNQEICIVFRICDWCLSSICQEV